MQDRFYGQRKTRGLCGEVENFIYAGTSNSTKSTTLVVPHRCVVASGVGINLIGVVFAGDQREEESDI